MKTLSELDSLSHRKISVVMLGVRSHFAVPLILFESGFIRKLYVDFWFQDSKFPYSLANKKYLRALYARVVPTVLHRHVCSVYQIGFIYAILTRLVARHRALSELLFFVYGKIFKLLFFLKSSQYPDAAPLYVFEGGVVGTPTRKIILEQTIVAYHVQDKVHREEVRKWPSWGSYSYVTQVAYALQKKREKADWRKATRIICPSVAVLNSLLDCGVPESKLRLVGYGVDLEKYANSKPRVKKKSERLRVLFVGDLSLRKGAPYLLNVIKTLHDVPIDFTLCGSVSIPKNLYEEYKKYFNHLGVLSSEAVIRAMESSHVMLFPSNAEGSAMALIEATASGLPIICSAYSGSRIESGTEGFIVSEQKTGAYVRALLQYVDNHTLIESQSCKALLRRQELSIARYREQLFYALEDL